MSDSPDANLQLKKKARRRLVGAVAFAGLAAVVLPMVMDEEPKQQVQDVQIRIPGQDQTTFSPKVVKPTASADKAVVPDKGELPAAAAVVKAEEVPAGKSVEKTPEKTPDKTPEKVAETKTNKPVEKAPEKPSVKSPEKPAEKPADKTAKSGEREPQRAAAILGGKAPDAVSTGASANSGSFVILIGAFSNPANVKQLQSKIGELGIKVFTESLDSPDGKKTRVRAGPFPSREAADKALDKMKRIGVNGVVAGKQ